MKITTLLTIFLAILAPAGAETFRVDINGGDGPTQDGWSAFDPTTPTLYPDALGPGQAVTVSIAQDGGVTGERNRNRNTTITGPHASLNNLLVDFYGTRRIGNVVTLSLALPPGTYSFMSYHHNAENNNNTQDVTAAIVLNDLVTDISNPSSSFTMVNGATNLADFSTYQTEFTLTTAGIVDFTLNKTEGSGEHGFNGFEITELTPGGAPEITDFQIIHPDTVLITFSTVPGNVYEIRNGTMLNDFEPLETLIADGFTESYVRSGPGLLAREFFVVENLGPAPPLFMADFETGDDGFTVAPNSSGTSWQRGRPDSSGPGGSVSGGSGGSDGAWGTGLGALSSDPQQPGFYVAGTSTRLRSGVIDLTGVTSATLSFDEAVDMQVDDSGVVNIIDDLTDDIIASAIHISTDADMSAAPWVTVSGIELPPAALNRSIRLEFVFEGDGNPSFDWMGWYIDNVVINR